MNIQLLICFSYTCLGWISALGLCNQRQAPPAICLEAAAGITDAVREEITSLSTAGLASPPC